jgi:hypothetical protein
VIRASLFVLFAAAVFAAILHASIWFFLIPIGLLVIGAYTVGGLKLRCPACGKRIKLGYTSCHHCGRSVVASKAE